jgi:ATP-dependent Clp protease protease subunit
MKHKFMNGHAAPGDRRWYEIKSAKSDEPAEVFIYDEIGRGFFGGGLAAEDFIEEVKKLGLKAGDELTVHINSPGGDLFDGNAMYNYLRTIKAKVTVRIDGVAASAASIVAMAGDRIEMPENSFLFIHNPWMFVAGDAAVMRKVADDLDQLREGALATYLRATDGKLTRAKLIEMLDAETWLTAQQAVEHGFADQVDEPVRAAALARFDLAQYGFPVPPALAEIKQSRQADIQRRREQLKLLKN